MADDENDFEEPTPAPPKSKKRKASRSDGKSDTMIEPAPKKVKLTKKDSDLRTQDSKVKEKDPPDNDKKPVQQKITKTYKKKSPKKDNDKTPVKKPKTKIIIDDDDEPKQSDNDSAKESQGKRNKKQKGDEDVSEKATPPNRKNNLLKVTPRKGSRSPSRGSASSEVSFEEHEDEAGVEWNFNAQASGETDKDDNVLSSFFDVDDEPEEQRRPVFLQLADQSKPKRETKKRQKKSKSSKTAIISELASDLTQLNEGGESSGSTKTQKDEVVSDLTDFSQYDEIELTEEDLAKITEQEILSQSQSIKPSVPSPPKVLPSLNVQPVPVVKPVELPLRDEPQAAATKPVLPASQPVNPRPLIPASQPVNPKPLIPASQPATTKPKIPVPPQTIDLLPVSTQQADIIKPISLSQKPLPKSPTRLTASRTPQNIRNNNNNQNRGFNQLPLATVPTTNGNNNNTNTNTNSNSSTDSDLATQSSLIKSKGLNNNSLLASNQPSRNQSLDNSINFGSLQSPLSSQSSQVIKERYLKLRILYICPPPKTQYYKEKKFYGQNDKGDEYHIVLKDDWEDTPLKPGDYINVVGKPEPNNPMMYVIHKTRNCVILHPDQLITGTLISESIKCQRLPVLDIKTKNSGESKFTIVGKIMHEVFQKALDNNDFSEASLKQHIEILILLFLENLYSVDCQESDAKSTLEGYIPAIMEWAKKYCVKVDANENEKNSRGGSFSAGSRQKKYKVQICQVLEIEENILSLMYGLKGNIDLSVEALIQNERGFEERVTVPLELKTGNKQVQHEAQVVLYGLLMGDRYNAEIKAGLLYSMKEREMKTINITRDQVVGLLRKRNELVSYIVSNKLPPMIRSENTCKRCFSADKCTIYGKLEGITEETSGMGAFFTEKTKHLKASHLAFLTRYERLLYLEEQELVKLNKQIWQMDISSREKNGRCLSGMFLEEEAKVDEYWTYRFRKENENELINIFDLQINEGDHVFLTMEGQEIGSDKGTVIELTPKNVVVELRAPVKTPANVEQFASSQRFGGLMLDIDDMVQNTRKSSKKPASLVVKHTDRMILKDLKWRIDKEEMVSSQTARTNLMKLFMANDVNAQRKRELIVDLDPPQFNNEMTDESINNIMSQHSGSAGAAKNGIGLNFDQNKAARKALAARDYLLISGKPGTGKTTAIVVLIHMLIKSGKTVLVTAYTHSAVDNICLKLKERGIDFLRIGGKHQVHPDIHSYIPNYEKNVKTFADIEQSYGNKNIVALTCMSASTAPLIRKRTFDYCILDEASQLTLPISLGPIFFAHTFILVGDPYQLPPLVKSPEAKQEGLDVSLFFYLSQTHPEAVVELDHQYRMNADIMMLSNRLIYDGKLRVGSTEVAQSCLQIPRWNLPQLVSPLTQDWLREILQPRRKVIFLNTDNVPAPEIQHEDNIVRNEVEASLVSLIADTMVWCGIKQQKIGVISPWRSQLKAIHYQLTQVNLSNLEVHTVDKYQGRDKDCIIVSLVRNNPQQNLGNLLREWRRLNVALTRAKTKLILIGSRSTFSGQTLFTSLLELVDQQQWQVDLPLNAHQLYIPRKRQSGSSSTQM